MSVQISDALRAKGLKPVAELARQRPCGDRLTYMAGCRCALCRKANSSYENERQKARRNGDWNGIVSAANARAHLRALSRKGVGTLAVRAATDIARSILVEVRKGTRKHIRARTERKILAVGKAQMSDAALVDAKETWRLIRLLQEEGYTLSFIANKLGRKHRGIQIGKTRVQLKTKARIKRLYRELTE